MDVLCLDFSKVAHSPFLNKMEQCGMDNPTSRWISSWLSIPNMRPSMILCRHGRRNLMEYLRELSWASKYSVGIIIFLLNTSIVVTGIDSSIQNTSGTLCPLLVATKMLKNRKK